MADEAGPSNLPDEDISAFINLTSGTHEQAAFYLEACDGQLAQAVARFYDNEGSQQDRRNTGEASEAGAFDYEDADDAEPEPEQRRRSPFGFLRGGVSAFIKAVKIAASLVGYLGNTFLPGNIIRALEGAGRSLLLPRVSDPVQDAQEFRDNYLSQWGSDGPNWQPMDWQEAARQAHSQLKMLFVYLHSPDHEDTERFCQTVLNDSEVASYINEHFMSWGGSVHRSQAFQLSQKLRVTRFPCVALLAYSGARVKLAALVQGSVSANALLTNLQHVEELQSAQLVAERHEHQEREFNRTLREEQDAAYQQSLQEDMEREQERQAQRRAEEERQRIETEKVEAERRRKEQEEQDAADNVNAMIARQKSKAENLRTEPTPGEASVAVRIRLPNGRNCQRRFVASRPVQDVFDFVESLEDFKVWEFNLVSSFPKKVLEMASTNQSFEELGLAPQATLFVQSLDE